MKIPKHALIEKACSDDPNRWVLNEPWIDAKDSLVIATTGKILAAVPVEDANGGYLSSEALVSARKLARGDTPVEIGFTPERLPMLTNGAILPKSRPEREGAQFPNWRQVVPKEPRQITMRIGINLSQLVALAAAIGSSGSVVLEIEDPTKPFMVRPKAGKPGKGEQVIRGAFGVMVPTVL